MEFVIIIDGVENKILNNVFVTANNLKVIVSTLEVEHKNNLYYNHDQSESDPVGIEKDDTEEIACQIDLN